MANLGSFNVVAKANKGSVLEITAPTDLYDEKSGELLYQAGEVLTDKGEKIADPKNIKPYYVKVLGTDSNEYRRLSNRRLEVNNRLSKREKAKITVDSITKENAEIFAHCTTECYIIGEDGKAMACTSVTMTELYVSQPWIFEQVDAFMADRSNFTGS